MPDDSSDRSRLAGQSTLCPECSLPMKQGENGEPCWHCANCGRLELPADPAVCMACFYREPCGVSQR